MFCPFSRDIKQENVYHIFRLGQTCLIRIWHSHVPRPAVQDSICFVGYRPLRIAKVIKFCFGPVNLLRQQICHFPKLKFKQLKSSLGGWS